jgi:ATP synthase protein I
MWEILSGIAYSHDTIRFFPVLEMTEKGAGGEPLQTGKPVEKEPCRIGEELSETVGVKEARKIRARRQKDQSVWFGLGMFGLVGWSVAIPTLLGIALGVWIDLKWPSRYSWTLMLLIIGIVLGCLNAWFWVTRERKMIGEEKEEQGCG